MMRWAANSFNGWVFVWWIAAFVALTLQLEALLYCCLFAATLKTLHGLLNWERQCKTCGSDDVIPADSPVGRRLLAD
ncbi:hypothetical protein [Tautonia plasticadhaerens]|uniref:hypothetical protein n=1 Tax=Tautonia plasticadhaerens TaxID=2527974 RepID=UPI00119CDA9A|nr:hypothetical protein [Tautonia plasticadhaerens]